MPSTSHLITPPVPVRAFALAAVLAILGVAAFLAGDLWGLGSWWRVLGLALILVGLAMVLLALRAARTGGVKVELDDEGLRIGRSAEYSVRWAEVTRVTRSTGRISLYRKDSSRITLVVPPGGGGDLASLGADIAEKLDVDRGYAN